MAVRGDNTSGERWFALRSRAATREVAYYLFYAFFLAELADILASPVEPTKGLAEVNAALCYAEEIRIPFGACQKCCASKGEILAKQDPADPAAVEDYLARSLDLGGSTAGGFSWELPRAISLAGTSGAVNGRGAEARELLGSFYGRFHRRFRDVRPAEGESLLEQQRKPWSDLRAARTGRPILWPECGRVHDRVSKGSTSPLALAKLSGVCLNLRTHSGRFPVEDSETFVLDRFG